MPCSIPSGARRRTGGCRQCMWEPAYSRTLPFRAGHQQVAAAAAPQRLEDQRPVHAEVQAVAGRELEALVAVVHPQRAFQHPQALPVGLAAPARVADLRRARQLHLDQLDPAARLALGHLAPQVARLGVAPDLLRGARAQPPGLRLSSVSNCASGTPSPAASRPSSTAVGLLCARSTFEIIALLTPERSASSARLKSCACRSASSRVAMSVSMFSPGAFGVAAEVAREGMNRFSYEIIILLY
jgi:hypothetical protein